MTKWLWYLFLIFIPVGTRLVIVRPEFGFFEFGSYFVYVSDFLFIILLGCGIYRMQKKSTTKLSPSPIPAPAKTFVAGFLALAGLSVFLSTQPVLSLFAFIRLVFFVAFAIWGSRLLLKREIFLKTLLLVSSLAILEAGIGIGQVIKQGDLGLAVLGESSISTFDPGTSKIAVLGGRVIRASGTLPHPNMYAAFLLIGFISLCYLYVRADGKLYHFSGRPKFKTFVRNPYFKVRLCLAVGIFIVSAGLLFSFSRGGWLATTLSALVLLGLLAGVKTYRRAAGRLFLLLVASAVLLFVLAAPFIVSRASLPLTDRSLTERVLYNGMALYLTGVYPLGLGIGNYAMFTAANGLFQTIGLTRIWQWQPVHNLYLLIAAEIGIAGLLCFLIFLGMIGVRIFKNRIIKYGPERALTLALLVGLLSFGLFDHFLWTLQPGRFLLWLSIGLALSQLPLKRGN